MFFCSAFLLGLQSIIRMQLAKDHFSPVQALAAPADALMVHHQTYLVTAVGQQDASDLVATVPGRQPPPKKPTAPAPGRR